MPMSSKLKRGYFGIGVYGARNSTNVGTLWRSALEFDAAFMLTTAARCAFVEQASNTTRADRHIPTYCYLSLDDFLAWGIPNDCRLVGVEQTPRSVSLEQFEHPERAIYLLGAEDTGLPEKVWEYCTGGLVAISTTRCLNVAVAGSIVMYDRALKALKV